MMQAARTAVTAMPEADPDTVPEVARARLSDTPLTDAFPSRRPTHWSGRAEPVADPHAAWQALLDRPRRGKTVAYIHVPYCANHCLFCGFYRNSARPGFSAPYAVALAAELALDAARLAVRSGPVHAVYLGGGTPTALATADLRDALRAVRDHLPLASDCEITVEGRVFDFDLDKAEACCAAGANRFSIGIQTFDTALRRRLGRRADRAGAVALLAQLRGLDQAAVVCDLIYGLPGQSQEMWEADVRTVMELELDGVDLYALSLFPGGPLAASIAKGALPQPAGLAGQARMYGAGLEMLDAAGWRHLTQAHWARTTRERNLYNQFAKEQATCLAYGAGAGGLLAGHRYILDGDESSWRRRIAAAEKPLAMLLTPALGAELRAAIQATLETGRIIPERLDAAAGPGFVARLAPVLAHWTLAGLLQRAPGSHLLTPAGWFWQTNLIAALFDLAASYHESLTHA